VGPSPTVRGCIRVAVRTNSTIQIITSSCIKCVTDGGDLPHISNNNSSQHIFNLLDTNVDFSIPRDPINETTLSPHFEFTDSIGNPDDNPILSTVPHTISSPNLRGARDILEQSISQSDPPNVHLTTPHNTENISSILPNLSSTHSNLILPSNSLDCDPTPLNTVIDLSTELRGDKKLLSSQKYIIPSNKSLTPKTVKFNNEYLSDTTNIGVKNKRTTYEEKIQKVFQSKDHLSKSERLNIRNK
jgi:hypothetical protein